MPHLDIDALESDLEQKIGELRQNIHLPSPLWTGAKAAELDHLLASWHTLQNERRARGVRSR